MRTRCLGAEWCYLCTPAMFRSFCKFHRIELRVVESALMVERQRPDLPRTRAFVQLLVAFINTGIVCLENIRESHVVTPHIAIQSCPYYADGNIILTLTYDISFYFKSMFRKIAALTFSICMSSDIAPSPLCASHASITYPFFMVCLCLKFSISLKTD